MIDKIEEIIKRFDLESEETVSGKELENLRVKYLGKKSEINDILKSMGKLEKEKRAELGKKGNYAKKYMEERIASLKKDFEIKELELKFEKESIDVTIPVEPKELGELHPLTRALREIEDIFVSMGFSIVEGPEIETVENNFDALNAPKDHPSRDMTDTFYLEKQDLLLRTQTSPVQVRIMRNTKPPIKIISPGRCYRSDTPDASHSPMFNQIEGLVIDKGISFANFKYTLELFLKKYFSDDTEVKFRPHNFPFTEPSAEVDISCSNCMGKGCSTCKGEGFIEILGAGMVHPNVLENCNIDSEIYSGFAFGVGIERIAMMKYQIDDIRYFYENDVRFLKQV